MPQLVSEPAQRFIQDISPKDLLKVERRMRSRKNGHALLKEGESLESVIRMDNEILEQAGITHDQIAARLEYILGLAHKHRNIWTCDSSNVKIGQDNFFVRITEWSTIQKCPFRRGLVDNVQHECSLVCNAGFDYFVVNNQSDKSVEFQAIMVHLIRDHQFLGGSVLERLDPLGLIELLNITPKVDYTPRIVEEEYWKITQETSLSLFAGIENVKKYYIKSEINSGAITAFVAGEMELRNEFTQLWEETATEEQKKTPCNTRPFLFKLLQQSKKRLVLVSNESGHIIRMLNIGGSILDNHENNFEVTIFTSKKRTSYAYTSATPDTITD